MVFTFEPDFFTGTRQLLPRLQRIVDPIKRLHSPVEQAENAPGIDFRSARAQPGIAGHHHPRFGCRRRCADKSLNSPAALNATAPAAHFLRKSLRLVPALCSSIATPPSLFETLRQSAS